MTVPPSRASRTSQASARAVTKGGQGSFPSVNGKRLMTYDRMSLAMIVPSPTTILIRLADLRPGMVLFIDGRYYCVAEKPGTEIRTGKECPVRPISVQNGTLQLDETQDRAAGLFNVVLAK